MALVRTDYGLIYNTDGSLCATLLPEGGVAVEEGTTNLLGTVTPKGGGDVTVTTEITHYTNQPVFYCDGSADWQGITANQRVTLTAGTEYTFSVYVYNPSTGEGSLNIAVDSDEVINEGVGHFVVPPGPGWHRIVQKWSPSANRNVNEIRFENGTGAYWQSGSNRCYMTAPQLEQKPFATSFVDGTRAAGALSYPQLLNKKRGTLSVWINPHVVVDWNTFFSMNLSTGRFLLYFFANGSSTWDFGPGNSGPTTSAGTIVAGQWTLHTLTWDTDAGVYRYYVNGELVGSRTYVEPDSLPSALPTVTNYGALIDELLILPYAVSPETVATWHSLDAPFYDPREITTAELAAKQYAEAQADLARATAEAYADGIVEAEEQARIADAQQKLQEAKQYAEQKAQEAEAAATAVANEAKQAAEDAQSAADTANALLADIASDSKLTPDEKQATKKEWDIIVGEKPVIEAQATTYEITTETTAYTAAYNALNTYITPLLQDLTTTSSITGSTFRSKFKNYYDAKTALLKKISDVAHALTQADIDATKRTIYAPGVIIDSTGAWGISGGVKQAGFGTDGKWIAGGGKVVSDAQGLRTYDKPYTNPAAVKQVEIGTDGKISAGGGNAQFGAKGLVVDKNGVDQVAVGDISGREWKGSPLPSGTFGLWAPNGFIAVSENESKIVIDEGGVHTTSNDWQDIPGFTVTIPVEDSAAIFITARFNARVRAITNTYAVGYFRLLRNGTPINLAAIGIDTGGSNIILRAPAMCSYLDKLNAGTYQYKCQFRSIDSSTEVSLFSRELIINVMKR